MQETNIVYSAAEVCQLLKISRSSFDKLRKMGVFKSLKGIRRNEKFPANQVWEYVNGQTPKQETK